MCKFFYLKIWRRWRVTSLEWHQCKKKSRQTVSTIPADWFIWNQKIKLHFNL